MPRATFPASFCPAGRQGQRRVLYHLPGWRSSALPFRPIGGAPGTAPLFLHPAARETDAARPFPPMRTGGQSLPFSTFSYRPAVLLSLPSRPASDAARHFSCIHLSRRTAGTAPLSLPPARAAEQRAPFSPYRRRARRCISFFYTQPTGQRMPRAVAPFPQTGKRTLSLSHTFGQRARPFPFTRTGGLPLPFSTFSGQQACASGRRPRTAHPPCSCARLLLFAAAPAASLLRFPPRFAFRAAHSCARVPSAPVSSVPRRLVPRRRALCPALFLRGRTHRAVLSPFPSRAARLSCPAPPVRPACAHRVETGEAVKPAAARSAHARPCSCAGGRIAPFFRLSPRAPRAFLALRPLCARPVRIASRRGKL